MTQQNTFLVTQIIHGSYVDGPGMRCVFFFKGCPLKCGWCQNPETQQHTPEILYDERLCIHCLSCVDCCSDNAIDPDKEYFIDRTQCSLCLRCIDECPTKALQVAGKKMTVDEIMAEIEKDTVFYESSGGGVTFSGGEPLVYWSLLRDVLRTCRQKGIHTCIDTSCAVGWDHIEFVKEDTDLFLIDIKHTTRKEFKADLVFANGEKLARTARIWIRIPVVPGLNDTVEEMQSIADKLGPLKSAVEQVSLLPFHNTAEMKYRYLNRDYREYTGKKGISEVTLNRFEEIFKKGNFVVSAGG